jgi:hypothetical protein
MMTMTTARGDGAIATTMTDRGDGAAGTMATTIARRAPLVAVTMTNETTSTTSCRVAGGKVAPVTGSASLR